MPRVSLLPIEEDARDSQDEEEEIQGEITALKQRRLREKKKIKKKERAAAAKRRRRAALGMDLNAVELPEHDQVFSLATITSKGDLEAAREVDLDKVTDDQLFDGRDQDEDGVVGGSKTKSSLKENQMTWMKRLDTVIVWIENSMKHMIDT